MRTKDWRRALGVGVIGALLAAAPSGFGAEREAPGRVPAAVWSVDDAEALLGEWRRVELRREVLDRMGLADGDLVADVGAGLGWYSLAIADRVAPNGRVFAVEVQQGMLDRLERRMTEAGVRNLRPVLGRPENPLLPPGRIDWVLLVAAYHEFSQPRAMLARIKESLAPGGRVALLEYRAEQDLSGVFENTPPPSRLHFMSIGDVMSEWTEAGFELEERAEFLPAQHVFIFKAAGDEEPGTWKGGGSLKRLAKEQTARVSVFADNVYLSGQPGRGSFESFRDKGVKTVVNLRTAPEMADLGYDERAEVEAAGMTYLHVPMRGGLPDEEGLQKLLEALDMGVNGHGDVLLHCASANRVGAVWSVFRADRHGLPVEEALAEGEAAGLRSRMLMTAARAYLRRSSF